MLILNLNTARKIMPKIMKYKYILHVCYNVGKPIVDFLSIIISSLYSSVLITWLLKHITINNIIPFLGHWYSYPFLFHICTSNNISADN